MSELRLRLVNEGNLEDKTVSLNNNLPFPFFSSDLVLAISCYQCAPQLNDTTCTSGDINITDCDTLGGPKGFYDACIKTTSTVEMSMEEKNVTMYTMNCTVKVI